MSNPSEQPSWWRRRAEDLSALMLLSMAVSFLIQIVWRYLLNNPQGWTVEYVALSWLWGILFGYAFVVRDSDVIRLDLVYNLFSIRARALADIVGGSIVVALLLYSLPASIEYVKFMGAERTAFLQLGFDLVFAVYPPFVVVVSLRTSISVARAARSLLRHGTSA